jgi:hypothetical protein
MATKKKPAAAAKKTTAKKKPEKTWSPDWGDPMFSLRLPPKLMARVDAAAEDINTRFGGFQDQHGNRSQASRSSVVRYMLAHALEHWEHAGKFLLLWQTIDANGDVVEGSSFTPSPGRKPNV